MPFSFVIEPDGDKWHAYCKELPGCHTFGDTKKEAMKHLKDAALLYLEDEIENQSLKAMVESNEKEANHVKI